MIILGIRRYLALASLALLSASSVAQLFGTLTPGGGLMLLSTSTHVGSINTSQTLVLDLMTAETADVEIRLVNVATNQVVAAVTKLWDYPSQTPGEASWSAGSGTTTVSISPSGEMDNVNITSIPAGNYRVELDMLFPDYWGSYPSTWYMFTNYFSAGYGGLYIDVGANISDVWSWGGASLILQ